MMVLKTSASNYCTQVLALKRWLNDSLKVKFVQKCREIGKVGGSQINKRTPCSSWTFSWLKIIMDYLSLQASVQGSTPLTRLAEFDVFVQNQRREFR